MEGGWWGGADLGQRGGADHQALGLPEARVALGDHIHRLLPQELQGVQTAGEDRLTLTPQQTTTTRLG